MEVVRPILLIGKLGSTAAGPSRDLFSLRCPGVFFSAPEAGFYSESV